MSRIKRAIEHPVASERREMAQQNMFMTLFR
jgi:hypothetical protein